MADPAPANPTALGAGLELVRDNGLIVLALLALMWQVYFLGTLSRENQAEWRKTVNEMQSDMVAEQRQRNENTMKLVEAMVKMHEVLKTTEMLLSDVEEACQIQAIKRSTLETERRAANNELRNRGTP